MPFHSFDDLQRVFRNDARDAFLDLVDRRPGEQICAFALVTDDDASGASGAGDTVERRARRLATRNPQSPDKAKYHNWEFTWHPSEWDAIYTEVQPKTRPEVISARDYFHGMLSFRTQWVSQPGHSDRAFRRNALRAMIDALADLDSDGVFGQGRQREAITIFIEMPDSNDGDILKLWSADQLNPRIAADRIRGSLPGSGRLMNVAVGLFQWFLRGQLVARRLPSARTKSC